VRPPFLVYQRFELRQQILKCREHPLGRPAVEFAAVAGNRVRRIPLIAWSR
jgi:hypothetical protein